MKKNNEDIPYSVESNWEGITPPPWGEERYEYGNTTVFITLVVIVVVTGLVLWFTGII